MRLLAPRGRARRRLRLFSRRTHGLRHKQHRHRGGLPIPGRRRGRPPTITYNELGGVILLPDSGLISVRLTISSGREVPYGQLSVYLLTDNATGAYCGQNLPDSPTWRSLPAGWTTTVTVTGFQVFRLPCAVTGVRVMFHSRNSGALTPPTPAETIAEATVPVGFQISQPSRP